MKVAKDQWDFRDEYFGVLLKYVKDPLVTDINFNGERVWIEHLEKGRYPIPNEENDQVTDQFVRQFATRVSNLVSEQLNQYKNVLEAETDDLRISIIDNSTTDTGYAISIRKTPALMRMNKETMLAEEYCSETLLNFLCNCILGKMNMVFSGEPGAGKTELLKFLTQFIPHEEKVITIEDNLEIHFREINPGSNCVAIKVDEDHMTYTKAIKTCLRQNPQWVLLSEARSTEVKYLIECFSTGLHGLTTLHTDDVRKIPDRISNMMEDASAQNRVVNDVHTFLNVGIMIRKRVMPNGKVARYVDQVCMFDREEDQNKTHLLVDEGRIINTKIPENIMKKFAREGIVNPWLYDQTEVKELKKDDIKQITMLGSQKHTDMFKNNVNVFADEMPLANMQKKKDPEKLTDTQQISFMSNEPENGEAVHAAFAPDTLSNRTEEKKDSYRTELQSLSEKKDAEKDKTIPGQTYKRLF